MINFILSSTYLLKILRITTKRIKRIYNFIRNCWREKSIRQRSSPNTDQSRDLLLLSVFMKCLYSQLFSVRLVRSAIWLCVLKNIICSCYHWQQLMTPIIFPVGYFNSHWKTKITPALLLTSFQNHGTYFCWKTLILLEYSCRQ